MKIRSCPQSPIPASRRRKASSRVSHPAGLLDPPRRAGDARRAYLDSLPRGGAAGGGPGPELAGRNAQASTVAGPGNYTKERRGIVGGGNKGVGAAGGGL